MEAKDVEAIYPLAPMQQGMMFHTLYSPETEVYTQQLKYTLEGELDAAAFRRAWERVLERHAALRTAFVEHTGQPLQVVLRRVALPWEEHDWRGLTGAEQQARLEAFLAADLRRGFDLSRPPLMRVTLVRLADRRHQFVWSHHHLILDGWSLWLIVKELFAFYHAVSEGRDLDLRPAPPYRNYVAWLKQQDAAAAKAFWQGQLRGFGAPTPLSIGEPPPAAREASGDGAEARAPLYREQHGQLAPEDAAALQAFARRHQLTLNTIVQGAWALLLSRYSGARDVVYGTVVAGRPPELPGVEEMVGLFINTLPARVQVETSRPLLPWLKELQRRQVETRQYEYSPLVETQRWSEVPAGTPLFESLLAFENFPTQQALASEDGDGLRVSEINSVEWNNYPLTLIVAPSEGLLLRAVYDGRRFTDEAVAGMLGHFRHLLRAVAADPERSLWELPLTDGRGEAAPEEVLIFDRELLEQRDYWLERLAGRVPQVSLPADFQQPPRDRRGRARFEAALDTNLCARLSELTCDSPFLLYTALLGALEVCLSRYTGAAEVLVGSPALSELGRANALVVSNAVDGGETFRALLEKVRATLLETYARQAYPYQRLRRDLAPGGAADRAPHFDVAAALEGFHGELPEVGHAVALRFRRDGAGVKASVEYDRALYREESIRALWGHFEQVLAAGVEGGDRPLRELAMMSEGERREVVEGWNGTARPYPHDSLVHELFERQAALTPEAEAVSCGGLSLSYRELNRRANRLARRLNALGVGRGDYVGVYMEHGPEVLVALLGSLKAGAAYVPLEPGHPAARLSFILSDARPGVVLTLRTMAGGLPPHDARLVLLDEDEGRSADEFDEDPAPTASPEDLAYVIYTSGSTGRPKGVQVSHRALVNYVWWAAEVYLRGERLASALYSSLAFDLTVTSVFVPLVTGGPVVVYRWEGREPPLGRVVAEGRAGLLKLTPSHLALLRGRAAAGVGVRRLVVGGEALTTALAREVWESFAGGVEVFNEYGPTEATVGCMLHRFDPARDTRAAVPIGGPAANVRIYVLDARLEPAPVNVAGEIYIAGDGLARGYLNRPGLTAERFIPDPFQEGRRMYRTGDLARRLHDGSLEYLGRGDDQVKFHGHRVELREVEWALRQHPQVRDAVARVLKDDAGQEVMVGYYVSRQELEPGRLRESLREFLVEETIPNLFVHLRRLPLTLNGKVNYGALPTLEDVRRRLGQAYAHVAPRNEAEARLAGIWARALGLERVGVEENFFELGGHSLIAMQMLSRIREAFGVELPLRAVFDRPTVAGLADLVERASAQPTQSLPPVLPADRAEPLPLSFAQERLWFLDRFNPQDHFYNIVFAVRLKGRLDVAAAARSLSEITRRHEVLRTSFVEVDGRAVQVVGPPKELSLPVEDLSGLPDAERGPQMRARIAEAARRPFNLAEGPLLRAKLLRLGEEEHVAVLTMHHIVSDGWSTGILVREFAALYAACVEGAPSPLEELPVQYADYAVWQRARLRGEALGRELDYWRRQLEGAPSVLGLPTDRPRPAAQTYRGGRRQFTLDAGVSAAVREAARREAVTPFMLLLAGYAALLSRYSGQEEVVVGSPVAGRGRAETEGLIGFFVNTLALRADLSGDPTFRELLGRVRETVTAAQEHQEAPFERIVEELQPERSLSHSPLFQVVFAFQNAPRETLELPGLRLSVVENEASVAKFDLTLEMIEGDDGRLYGGMDYNEDLFEPATVDRMLEHFQTLLEAAVADPARRVSALPMLTRSELKRLLGEWAGSEPAYPRDESVSRLFERQAEETPDAVAVVFGDEQLTYRQLNARANGLARRLRRLGVGPEVRVGLCLERSTEMVVGMLAIIKAGGAYVPLDPSYPRERLSFMLGDARAAVVLTERRFEQALAGHTGTTVCLDALKESAEAESDENPAEAVTGDHLAYVMYTSGSTGTPKASCIPHRAVVRLVKATDYAEFGPEHTFLQFAPVSFDASTLEIWGSLLNGGRLAVLPPHAPTLDELGRAIREHGVTSLWLTSGLFNQMVEDQLDSLRGVRQLLAGGDVLSVPHVRRALEELKGCRLVNGYGPTENTTFTCCHRIEESGRLHPSIPIGRPIANTRVYVLDRRRQLVPPGVAGELCVGGDGLSRGYLNDPRLTAEKFIPNPFAARPGERLYRTGDLVRHLPDGTLEFIGRVDNQVKVRGFRVEPGEIEATLGAHPRVRESAVVVADAGGGAKRVAAYVVARPGETLSAAELRAYCQEKLPKYMTPSAFVLLDALPLTPNGKVDRRALAATERDEGASEVLADAPRTPIEEALVGMWAEVLDLKQVGIHDNFFELGGHSLATTQIASRVGKVFQVQLPLRALFEAPTIAELALRVEEELSSGPSAYHAAPIPVAPRDEPLPLSFAQQRLWFLDQFEPQSSLYNISSVVRLTGRLDAGALGRSMSEIVRRHEVLRTAFTTVEGEPRQVILPAEDVKIEAHDLSGLPAEARREEAERLAADEGRRPFDLARPPLLRVALLRLDEEEHVAVLTMHHIVSDGWSLGVLIREVAALYAAYREGRESPLPELPVQYADYAVWQRRWLQGEALGRELDYWRRQLEGAPTVLGLPTDRPRPAAQSHRGGRRQFTLGAGVSAAVREAARREAVTPFMLLLAGYAALLSRYSGQEDITVGTGVANRNRIETEALVGFFLNSLVLRTDLSGDPTFRELLGRVREMTLGAYAHQNLPFEKLVEALRPERSLSRNPLFQVWFILQNAPMPALDLPGLTLTPVELEPESSRFDLGMGLVDTQGGLGGWIEYNRDLFDEATIARMAGHYEALLARAVAEPETRLSELRELLDEKDRLEGVAKRQEYRKTVQEKLQHVRRRPNPTSLTY